MWAGGPLKRVLLGGRFAEFWSRVETQICVDER